MKIDYAKLLVQYLARCSPADKNSPSIKSFTVKVKETILAPSRTSDVAIQFSDAIDKAISTSKRDKEKLAQFTARFCQYVEREKGIKLEPRVLSAEVIDDPTERRLRMACFMHEPRSREEIITRFFQSERTVRNDLKALKEVI